VTRVIALTGNVAAGKSHVAQLLRARGATIIDADRIVRELQVPGQPIFEQIVAHFGREVLTAEGTLDRAALRHRILTDKDARRELERIVHPAVSMRRQALTDEARRRGDRVVVADIPLLFEADDPSRYDAILLVDAPAAVRRERLITERGLAPDEADRLLAAQLPSGPKRSASHFVIDNDGDLATLEARVGQAWAALVG
jgi:dephospho-CoA kinase